MEIFSLETLWFVLIAVLWCGYFVLEGFDFGVGMLLRVVGRDDVERRAVIHSIGPFWDGNEVWLLVAGGATFAAFPEWYATLFSGFYLPLLLILVALIVRGVAFEFRGKRDSAAWRDRWDWAITVSSLLPALLWGVAFANIVNGVPIDETGTYTGGFFNLLGPYQLLGGVTTLVLFLSLGASFLSLKTTGEIEARSRALRTPLAVAAGALLVVFSFITAALSDGVSTGEIVAVAAAVLAGVATVLSARVAPGWGVFVAGSLGAITLVTLLFVDLFPAVMPSSTDAAYSLTIASASSTHYTLVVMTVVALVMTPIVLLYQGWTYWVFRQRVGRERFERPAGGPVVPADGGNA